MELHLKFIGISLFLLAWLHAVFPARFEWKKDLQHISLINRQLMYVHTFFIALAVLLMGVLCFTSATELVQTPLGKRVCVGLGVFWGFRLYVQFFVYSPKLWRGKTFETAVHILFVLFWTYLPIVFLYIGLSFLRG
jgi:hypothetical protein